MLANDTSEQLPAKILNKEHLVYVEAVPSLCDDQLVWREDGVPLNRSHTDPDECT
ncbi:hypothetical protein PAHAL_6G253700 [Panicum hallii]|uniref:Uncharacterized protein n=1 Tax=Panicum hallii TaxID=206008 RepID=A0A2S3I3W1_9POAL|nr:hypothetical protein PAHAL_6G253700 [Panicum hallii]